MADFSVYPNAIDGYAQLPLTVDNVTRVDAVTVNRLRSAIVNIEAELGVLPSGSYDTVVARLDALESEINDLMSGGTPLEPEISILGPVGITDSYIDFTVTSNTLNFSPAPNDLIIKRIDLGFVGDIGGGLFDPNLFVFISDIKIDGISIMDGVVPLTALDPRYRADTPEFNRFVAAGQVISVETFNAGSQGGTFTQPLVSYIDGTSDAGLTKETYLGLNSTIHTGPPLGAAIFPGTGGVNATTVLTINTAPLAAGDEIVLTKAVGEPFTLTGSAGARVSGNDDFDATIGNVSDMAIEIAAALNDTSNSFPESFTATANTPLAGDVTISHFGGELGNLATTSITTTPAGGITPASGTFSGGESEVIELTFEAAPANMTLNRLYTTIISGEGSGALGALMYLGQITVNNGPSLITGILGTGYTSNGPSDTSSLGAGLMASPNLGISINQGDVVRVTLINDVEQSGGIAAGWTVTLD
jgi:hypothetical protein